jgi:PAS domain S-box-containing protein
MQDPLAHAIFESYPAPTFIVDDDVQVVTANRAARVMLGHEADPAPLMARRAGDLLRCVHSDGPGGCGRQEACQDCVLRNSVRDALSSRPVHRARAFLRLRRERGEVEVCALVSAARLPHAEEPRVVLTFESVSDVQMKDQVLRAEHAARLADEQAAMLARFPAENPDPVLRVAGDGELTVLYANEAARSVFGVLGLEVSKGAPSPLVTPVRTALGEGRRVRAEIACGDRVFALSCSPVGSEVNVYGEDVTERNRAHAQLATEKERLAVTLRSIGDGVIATDEVGRVTMLNGVAEELTGWRGGEYLGKSIEDVFNIVNENTRERASNPVGRALREGVVVGLANHTALVARDGTERPIADSAAPIRDATGGTLGAVLVFRDQTKERRAEQALRESEQRVRRKLESILSPEGDIGALQLADIVDAVEVQAMMDEFHRLAGIPMAVIDVEGRVLVGVGWQDVCTKFHRVHPQTCKHCIESDTELTAAVPAGEIRLYKCKNNMWDVATPILVGGHHLGNVFTGQFFFEDEPVDYELFRAQAARYGFDERQYLAALDAVPRLSRAAVAAGMAFLLKFAGMLSRVSFSNIKLARSLAERESLTRSLEESKARLEESDRRKTEFLAMLSHELRNPLAPIRNSIYILERAAPGGEQARRARDVLRRQSEHLTRLVDDLLDMTRVSRGKVELRRSVIDLRELVRKTAEDVRSLFDNAGVALRVELPAGPTRVDVDPTRMAQVLGNMLHNAVKFTPSGGLVTVGIVSSEGRANLFVRDDGVGMVPEQVEAMFEPFAQADDGLARSKGGLGLGLALVKALVELHGGSVSARSDGVGRGAEFVVTLPLASPATEGPAREEDASGTRRGRVVLVIDDNVDAGQSLAEMLELEGHVVHVARDGRSGVALARKLQPDVVLCDIGLPDIDGYEVARTLRRDDALRAIRLVALSGYAQPEDRQRATEAGFDAHVAKPIAPDDLMTAVADER